MLLKQLLEFRQERLNLPGEVKIGCKGIVIVDSGLERLIRHSLGKGRERGYLRREKLHDQICVLGSQCEEWFGKRSDRMWEDK